MKRVYFSALLVFVFFMAAVNAVTFVTAFNKKQLTNLYYVSERTQAIALLAEHVVFESGLILKEASYDEIGKYISDSCEQNGVDPQLVYTIISSAGNDTYTIDVDGAIGYMRVKTDIISQYPGKDPFSVKDNIEIGVAHLASLIDRENDLETAIEQYLTPSKTYHSADSSAQSRMIYSSYIGSLADKSR